MISNPPPNVKFLGIIPNEEMNSIYNCADILFMPSYDELFPMTILEASNVNIPILVRDLPLYNPVLFDKVLRGNNNLEFSSILKELVKILSKEQKLSLNPLNWLRCTLLIRYIPNGMSLSISSSMMGRRRSVTDLDKTIFYSDEINDDFGKKHIRYDPYKGKRK